VGCSFVPRCPLADDLCRAVAPALFDVEGRGVRCHHHDRVEALVSPDPEARAAAARARVEREPLLDVTAVTAAYTRSPNPLSARVRRSPAPPPTVEDVSFSIGRGETLALVGESGSGKSTLVRVIAGLHPPVDGEIHFDGGRLPRSVSGRSRDARRAIQLVFQNPAASLNPRRRVAAILERPLRLFFGFGQGERAARAAGLLDDVGLAAPYLARFPGQLSGGEKQRVAIARALSAEPQLILCDEVVSALDVSVQAAILRLLARLRAEHDVAYLFVSHDLAVVRAIADRVAVLYLGRLCEIGSVDEVYGRPQHPYTELLLAAVPEPVPGAPRPARPPKEHVEAQSPPQGCVFQRRCPRRIGAICDTEEPPWRTMPSGHAIRCHIDLEELSKP
jgi:peptide/nickel transport system ATP-binding protein